MKRHRVFLSAAGRGVLALAFALCHAATVGAQVLPGVVTRIDLPVGRSHPITMGADIVRASVALPDVADVVAINAREMVINAKANGETDILLWIAGEAPRHYRVAVHAPSDRMQVLVSVKFAEVRRDALTQMGVSALYRHGAPDGRVGTGDYRNNLLVDPVTGKTSPPLDAKFVTAMTAFASDDFNAMLQAQEEKGNVRTLAEPNIMAGNKEDASFLAGGEIPVPIAQQALAGSIPALSIQYREFGIRLTFNGEIISDSLIRLKIKPEVSTLDYANAVVLSGFRIPALRTRRVESTLDVMRDQSLVISGLFNDERQQVKTGIPYLKDIPVLGLLFSSTSWQRNETELVVIVTPVIIDPMRPRAQDAMRFAPDEKRPAKEALPPPYGIKPPAPRN